MFLGRPDRPGRARTMAIGAPGDLCVLSEPPANGRWPSWTPAWWRPPSSAANSFTSRCDRRSSARWRARRASCRTGCRKTAATLLLWARLRLEAVEGARNGLDLARHPGGRQAFGVGQVLVVEQVVSADPDPGRAAARSGHRAAPAW